MHLLTTTLCYPTPNHPDQGIFVQRRAMGLAGRDMDVQVVSPQPWCPLLRKSREVTDQMWPLRATYPRMLSIPVLNWATDGVAFGRAIERHILSHGGPKSVDLIDAHFEYPDGVGAWLAGRRLDIPVAVTVRVLALPRLFGPAVLALATYVITSLRESDEPLRFNIRNEEPVERAVIDGLKLVVALL